jgi:SAM-dependent MidA family methyltransferase
MRMALYEPEYGYYVTGAAKMGWEADYFTSTDVSNLFAHCMGRQLFAMWEKLKRPGDFVVLEQGAGRGHLAEGVRSWAQKEAPEFYEVLDYRSEDIRGGTDAIASHEFRPLETLRFSVVVSNELVDAFPVHIVEKRGQRLYEVFVDVQQDGRFCEVLSEPGRPEVAGYLDTYKIPWQTFEDGWRAEINLDALRWLQRTMELMRKGFVLTIDYGDKAKELYTARLRRGTLLCYYKHQANEQPLLHPGKQDITAHVNFSALIDEGRRLGMRLHSFLTQREWLQSLGIEEELERRYLSEFADAEYARATDKGQIALLKWRDVRQRVSVLTDLGGMGNFKVLILRR